MVLILSQNFKRFPISSSSILTKSSFHCSFHSPKKLFFPFVSHPFPFISNNSLIVNARKRNPKSDLIIKRNIIEEVSVEDDDDDDEEEEEEGIFFDEFQDDEGVVEGDGDDHFEDESVEDNAEVYVGDGGEGGGISLAGTWWDKEALVIAEEVILSFDGELKIYAFKTLSNFTVQVRIEKLSNKSGSPSMEDVEAFSTTYRIRLDAAELAKSVPENISLEVSSPSVERVVRIPDELDRFKERKMYVKYANDVVTTGSSLESDGVFRLVSFDMEARSCTWGLADVKVNREKAGKGRPLSKKQRDWRLDTPFDSLRLVRLYSDF